MSHSFKTEVATAAGPVPNGQDGSAGAAGRVRQLIANGKAKAAVEAAKELHKVQATAATEALLVDAYAARIQSLLDQNLAAEAKSLLELVRERYPAARERLNGGGAFAAIHTGWMEELLAPLQDPQLDAARRAAIEKTVEREVWDLAALADCGALPPEHPLRKTAAALQNAFTLVTSGPVEEDAVALPEVSHRSPLAAWKLLVRAIACLYRGDDAACRRYLEAIKPEAAPSRLAPAIQAMLGDKPARLSPAASALVSSTSSNPDLLRHALEELDRAFGSHKDGAILKHIREAVAACREYSPDQVDRLRQHIAVRAAVAGMKQRTTIAAMSGEYSQGAYFHRLFARAMEEVGEPESIATACASWEEFRLQAVREGWFAANGPEAATLYLHMAEVLQKLPPALLEELQRESVRQNRRSPEELYFLYPDKLYERACVLDSHFESFAQWMDWAKRRGKGKAEKVAEAWHKIRPMDIQPILHLMEEKENRKAFQSSLQYLAKAEKIDGVHPAVRRARLRLLAGSALRHIQQKKPHLAEQEVSEMAALPQSQQGDRLAFLDTLNYLLFALRGDRDRAAASRAAAEGALGSKAAAALLIFGVAHAAKQDALVELPALDTLAKSERAALPEAVVRVVELAEDMQFSQMIPSGWLTEVERQFQHASKSLAVGQLETLAQAALTAGNHELAYAVSAAGLDRGGATDVNFLLLRALALPQYFEDRRAVCASAAAQIARQRRNMEVVDRAVDLLADADFDDLSLNPEQASQVLRQEKSESAFPTPMRPGPDYQEFFEGGPCDCPECRRQRGKSGNPHENFEEDESDLDLDEVLGGLEIPPDMPPEIAEMILEETRKAVDRGESLDSLLNRLFGGAPGFGGGRRKGRRR